MDNLPNISFVGRSISRREDRRLLTGREQFIADLKLPQMLHAASVGPRRAFYEREIL